MLRMKHVIEKEDKHMFTIEWSFYQKGFYSFRIPLRDLTNSVFKNFSEF